MAIEFQANFVAANGTNLSALSPAFGMFSGSGSQITSNRARLRTSVTNSNNRTPSVISTANYRVVMTARRIAANSSNNDFFRLYARAADLNNAYYVLWYQGVARLRSITAGTPTDIGSSWSFTPTIGQDYTFELICNGDQISVKVDGATVSGPHTNTVRTAADYAGLELLGNSDDPTLVGWHASDFYVDTLGATASNAPRSQFYHLQGMR